MAVTLRFQSTGSIPGAGHPVTMIGNSLTIGRADENDLVLPDPDKTLSKRHCVIEDHNGNVVVVDISSNGTFLNYGKIALGATPTPLNSGDILTIGPYEILVDITSAEDNRNLIPDPLAEEQVSHGSAAAAPTASELLDAPGDGGDFLDDLLSGREGPVGHRGVNREEPDEDGLLPPLGPNDPLLPPAGETDYTGPTQSYHNPSAQDHFRSPGAMGGGGVIPDDWDDDFLAPTPPSGAPAATPAPQPGSAGDPFGEAGDSRPPIPSAPSAFIPDDFGLDSEEPAAPPAPAAEIVSTPEPAAPPEQTAPVPEPAHPPQQTAPVPASSGEQAMPAALLDDPDPTVSNVQTAAGGAPPEATGAPGFDDDDADTVMPSPPPSEIPQAAAVEAPPAAEGPVAQTAAQPAPPAAAPPEPPQSPPPAPAATGRTAAGDGASRAFLRAVGAEDVRVDDEDLLSTMSRLGHVLRIVIEGLREVLMTRTSIKSEFRIQQTVISAGGNNPLKFSISPEQAIEAMVKPNAKGYLDAADAAHEALRDIKAHEVAMVSGMEAALKGVLARLDPVELEGKIEAGGGIGGMLKSKKARYWEVYEKMYAEISDQAENEFHELFAKEFARAYQEQLDKLK